MNFQPLYTKKGRTYYFPDPYQLGAVTTGVIIHDEDFRPTTEDIIIENDKVHLVVRKGKVEEKRYVRFYNTDKGQLRVDQVNSSEISIGDQVLVSGDIPPSGIYKVSDSIEGPKILTIDSGVVRKAKGGVSPELVLGLVLSIIVFGVLIIVILRNN